MRKKPTALILLAALFSESGSAASDPLQLSARIENESLAEEAIDLLHCYSENTGLHWELGEGKTASHRLHLAESSGLLEGSFHSPAGEKKFQLRKGEAVSACLSLLPEQQAEALTETRDPEALEPPENHRKWIWIGTAAAAVLGFLILQSRNAAHRSLTMD